MRLQIFVIFLLYCTQAVANGNEFAVGDTLYVWADEGIIVRKKPSMEAEKLTKLNYGVKVVVKEIVDREWEYEVTPSAVLKNQAFARIALTGKFIRISLSESDGYVYSGLLSRLMPALKGESFEVYLARTAGLLKIVADVYSANSDNRFKRILYNNGAILQHEHGNENWWSHLYLIPDITRGEAYLLINRIVGFEIAYKRGINEKSEWIETHPTKFDEREIVLQTSAFEETNIKVEPHYILITRNGGN